MTASLINPLLGGHQSPPLFVVISGPSGVGKDSVLLALREREVPFHFVVTMNSRPPRPGEVDGKDYHFVTPQRFEEMIAQDELLEWARVYDQYKGVPRFEVRQAMSSGQDVIMRVNIDGAATIKQIAPEALLIFLAPPSLDELRQRLAQRHTESAEQIERRLSVAQAELDQVTLFDYVVFNQSGTLARTVDTICHIIEAEKHRVVPRRVVL
jgi:guanylate kinase